MFGASIRLFLLPFFCACLIGVSAFFSSEAHGAASTRILTKSGTPVLISATNMFGDSEKQTVELDGNVQLTFEGQSLRADRATMDKKNGRIIAEGNMILASPSAYVEGTRAEISYEDNTGLIYDGFVKSGQVLFQGKVIRKVGIDKYEAEEASYTACTTCPPAWSFSGSRINAEIGAYAYIKSAWFYLGGFRFFWLPYLIVPLKSERQSGVLFPSIEFETQGYAFGLPLFWAISRSQDMTITPKYYTKRGFKLLANYRYVLNEDSAGELNTGGLLKDAYFSQDTGLPNRPGDERSSRWFINHDHLYVLPGGFINRAKLNLVSDLRYTRDFRDEMKGLGDSALENRLSLTKNSELMHSSIEVGYYVNQLKTDPLDGNSDAVHRFPELRQSGVDRSILGSRIFFKWDANYVNFAREDLAFDDVIGAGTNRTIDRARGKNSQGITSAGSGTFEPGNDVIRTGQRLDLRPEISAPFRIGKIFDVLPTLQLRHTQYSFNVTAPPGGSFDTLPTRQYLRGSFAIRTQMSRIYDEETDEALSADGRVMTPSESSEVRKPAEEEAAATGIFQALQTPPAVHHAERLKHEIEPEISIAGLPWLQQSNSPFFSNGATTPIFMDGQPVSNSDFYSANGLQFDYNDRITQRNIVSALVTNRFTKKTWNGDVPVYRQIVTIKNGTSYEFDKVNREAAANFSDIFTIIDARLQNFDTNTSFRYFPLHNVVNTSSRVRVIDNAGNFAQVAFSQNYLITEKVEEAVGAREENLGFAIGFVQRYVTAAAELNLQPFGYWPVDWRPKSWSATLNLNPPGNCWGVNVQVVRILTEDAPHFIFGFNYNFGGTI